MKGYCPFCAREFEGSHDVAQCKLQETEAEQEAEGCGKAFVLGLGGVILLGGLAAVAILLLEVFK